MDKRGRLFHHFASYWKRHGIARMKLYPQRLFCQTISSGSFKPQIIWSRRPPAFSMSFYFVYQFVSGFRPVLQHESPESHCLLCASWYLAALVQQSFTCAPLSDIIAHERTPASRLGKRHISQITDYLQYALNGTRGEGKRATGLSYPLLIRRDYSLQVHFQYNHFDWVTELD
jgi:hypothetical protein